MIAAPARARIVHPVSAETVAEGVRLLHERGEALLPREALPLVEACIRAGAGLALLEDEGKIVAVGSLLRSVPRAVWQDGEEWRAWLWVSPLTFRLAEPGLADLLREAAATERPVTAIIDRDTILDILTG